MSLNPGTHLGPYEIIAPLGAGGMGEVYRARDSRLGREVAVKVLPAALSTDRERLRRFEQEARAAGVLNHPNLLTIYDVGTEAGFPYVVSELLEGETLRERLHGGALSLRKTIDYARQIALGLAAAHAKGIVHRDLKPENLLVTRDGRLKILDFGLAKLVRSDDAATQAATDTQSGVMLGTVGYMAPEQVRGQVADHRADIFGFGAVLYEMLTGLRAFHGATAADTLSAILNQEPSELTQRTLHIGTGLERVVRRCLEKSPEERFQSASDLAFALEALSVTDSRPASVGTAPGRKGRLLTTLAVAGILLLAVGTIAGFLAGVRVAEKPLPSFRQLTFRRGTIQAARFAPDGQTIVYGGAWEGRPLELFSTRAEGTESRSLGLPSGDILAISSSGEMALSLGVQGIGTRPGAP